MVKQITKGNHLLSDPFVHQSGLIAAVLSGAHEPGDLVKFTIKNPAPQKLTFVNDDLLEGRKLGEVEEIWYNSFDNKRIQGWIVKPPDFNPRGKYPLILYIHGGPHAMYSWRFNFELQNHAAKGYVVLYTNPHAAAATEKSLEMPSRITTRAVITTI